MEWGSNEIWNMEDEDEKGSTGYSPYMKSRIWDQEITQFWNMGRRKCTKLGTWNKVISFELGYLQGPICSPFNWEKKIIFVYLKFVKNLGMTKKVINGSSYEKFWLEMYTWSVEHPNYPEHKAANNATGPRKPLRSPVLSTYSRT